MPLHVGFDLDGVLYANPLGAVRPFLKFVRKNILKKQSTGSYTPKTKMEEFINYFYIKLSFVKMAGYSDLIKLIEEKKVVAYIITSRHSTYKKAFELSARHLNSHNHYKTAIYNSSNLEPYEFKSKAITDLKLDIYVEDNFDVVSRLNLDFPDKILWITNPIDKSLNYPLKFNNLKQVVAYLRNIT